MTLSGEIKSKTKREQKDIYPLLAAQVQRKSAQWPLALILFLLQETLQAIFNLSSKHVF